MTFDQRAYLRDVIVPLRERPGSLPPGDLIRQYAIDLAMDPRGLAEHLRKIRGFWNQRSGGSDSNAQVCAQLLTRDEKLRGEHGDLMHDPDWWRSQSEQQDRAVRAESERFADLLAAAYGGVGRLTPAQLATIAASWPGLSQAGIDEAVRRANLVVEEPVELPTEHGMQRTAYRKLRTALDQLGLPTVVQLLHPDLDGPFFLLGGLRTGSGPVPLDAGLVRRRITEANQAADSAQLRARKEMLGLLSTALDQGVDLGTLALFQILERPRAGRAQGLPGDLLVRQATDAGLAPADAQTLVANLPVGPSPSVAPADRVRDLVADGQLRAAQQALAALSRADDQWADLDALVSGHAEKLAGLLRDADDAVSRQREELAERLLREAARIAADDQDLVMRLDRLPPAPPRDPVATEHRGQVRLSWQPPGTTATEVRYRVVRAEGRPPASPGDGEVIGEDLSTEATDATPPPARELHYSVFASTSGAVWSRPASVTIRVLPPVDGVHLRVEPNEIACGWTAHRAMVAVRVRRTTAAPPGSETDGTVVPATPRGFVDRALGDGQDCFYSLVAVYGDAHGHELAAPMVVVRATPRGQAPPHVEKLRVYVTAVDTQTAKVRITWLTPATGAVSIRRAQLRPSWPPGTTLPRAELDRYGEPVVGDRLAQGDETMIEATVPSGQFSYVPFTLNNRAGTAVVGESVVVGVTEPVRQLRARRTGAEVTLSWVWPPGLNLVEIAATGADGATRLHRLTRGQYADGGGARLPVGSGGATMVVRGVERSPSGETFSAPAGVAVDRPAAILRYRIERVGGPFSRDRLLRVTVDQTCEDVELMVVAVPGAAMPVRADERAAVEHLSQLTLSPDAPWTLPFTLPRRLPKPYWLRCFVLHPDGVKVIDPVDDMKVS